MYKTLIVGILIGASWYGIVAMMVAHDNAMQKCQETMTAETCRLILR